MTDPNDEPKTPNVNADHNSNAVGSISAGGNIGDIHIGNVYQTPEDDVPLSSEEIENGLTRFAQYLPERAPVLQDPFSSIAKKLRATLGADQNSLSPALKAQREDGVDRMKLMCMEVTDISFRAMCLGQNPPPYDSRPPFLGLFAFRPEDREFFFGRDALVQKLVARIKAHPFLAVLGASGSGKSSLVMAGLVPALEAQMSYLTPSSAPLSQLLTAKESASAKTIFIIDQFEELFTHPHDAAERADFIHALLDLTQTNRVVITMRADFWGEVAIYSDLKQAMQEHQELIAPMTVDELHSAMEKQAAVVGLRFDPTLSESILAEVKGEPGAMPLLQHALWELWNRRHGLWIKAEEYQAFGGVKQAIASTAEEVYASCSDFERARVRDIFLRLTRLDESGEGRDTRRRVLIEELIPVNSDSSVTINLLNKLADARLIVKTDKDVEVAHEALIRHWSRLTEWLNEDRDNLRLREGVSESAREWDASKRDDSLLNHRGGRLELALAMCKLPRYQLNPIEQAYLNACVALRIKEQRERERRLRYTVITSIVVAIIFLVLGSFGLIKSNEATSQAGTAQANANVAATSQSKAEEQAEISRIGELAAQSVSLRDNNFLISLLLGVEAFKGLEGQITSVRAQSVLLENGQANPRLEQFLNGNTGVVVSAIFSPDGKTLASGTYDKDILLWDVKTRQPIGELSGNSYVVRSVAFSPDGKMLASGSQDTTITLWDMETRQPIGQPLSGDSGHSGAVTSVAFSPDGQTLVSGSEDKTIILWDIKTGQPIHTLNEHSGKVRSVAFSPDGQTLASGSDDGTIILWDVKTGEPVGKLRIEYTHPVLQVKLPSPVLSVAFSPDGNTLASGDYDKNVTLWDVKTGQPINKLSGHSDIVRTLAFSLDGKTLASGSADKTIILWNVETGQLRDQLRGHSDLINSLSFSLDGSTLASGSGDTTIILWDMNQLQPISRLLSGYTHEGPILSIAFSLDGKTLASGSYDKTIMLWDIEKGQSIGGQPLLGHTDIVRSVAFSPDGETLASGSNDKTIILWDVEKRKAIGHPWSGHSAPVASVAFSPDGSMMASGSEDKTIILWDVVKHQAIVTLSGHSDSISSLAFSPDGKKLASGSFDLTVILWDVKTYQTIGSLSGGSAPVRSVVFSSDNKTLASSSFAITLWDSNEQLWATASCQRAGRNFTQKEWDFYFPNEAYRQTCPEFPLEPTATPMGTP